jgi:hypothetical protein
MNDPTDNPTPNDGQQQQYAQMVARLNEALSRLLPEISNILFHPYAQFLPDLRTVCGISTKFGQDIPQLLQDLDTIRAQMAIVKQNMAIVQEQHAKLLLAQDAATYTGPVDPRRLLESRGYKFEGGFFHPPSATHQVAVDEQTALEVLHKYKQGELQRP